MDPPSWETGALPIKTGPSPPGARCSRGRRAAAHVERDGRRPAGGHVRGLGVGARHRAVGRVVQPPGRTFEEGGWLTGIEPATSGATVQRSNRLSYSHHAEQNLTNHMVGQKRRARSTVRGSGGTGAPSSDAIGTTPRTAFVRNRLFPASSCAG